MKTDFWRGIDLRIQIKKFEMNGTAVCGLDLFGSGYGEVVDFHE